MFIYILVVVYVTSIGFVRFHILYILYTGIDSTIPKKTILIAILRIYYSIRQK